MKKICLFLITFVFIVVMQNVSVIAAEDPFAGLDEVNIVYLGGSITQGAKASDPTTTSWVAKIGNYFKETYETDERTVNNHNMGIGGTGSDLGIIRLQRDVISKKPNLVFVEFAVNDKWKTEEETVRNMESIVLTLQQSETNPYVVFVYTTEQSLTTNSSYHQKVADFYGIPSIDLKQMIIEDEAVNIADLLADGTHPNDTGYEYYFQKIKSCMENKEYFKKPILKNEKLNADSRVLEGVFLNAKDCQYTGNWKTNAGSIELTGDDVGEITVEFAGEVFGLMHVVGTSGGKYTIEIDGVPMKTVDSYYSGVTSQMGTGYIKVDLENGVHKAVIKKLAEPNANSQGNTVRIVHFMKENENRIVQSVDFMNKDGIKVDSIQPEQLNIAYAELKNMTNDNLKVLGIVASYDNNGVLSNISTMPKTLAAFEKSNFGLGFNVDYDTQIKVFVWDGHNMNTIMPLSRVFKLQ